MSYDVTVFARDRLGEVAIAEIVASLGLATDDGGSSGTLTVTRGVRRRYSFTVELAERVEPEDVPGEVTALMLEPRWLYRVLVEGSFDSEIPYAIRFARKLAVASSGVVVDEQDGTLWSRGKLRTPPKVERGLIDVVELQWWVTNRTDPAKAAAAWLELARRYLPEALPRRWGEYEPLSHKVDPNNPAAFADFVARREGTVFFNASPPMIDGSFPDFRWEAKVGAVHLSVHRDALNDEAWRCPLQRLFIEFARQIEPIVATAEVVRDYEWTRGTLWSGFDQEHAACLGTVFGWDGLPPYPVWWSWFGPDYAPLVRDHLDPATVTTFDNGLFHTRSVQPADRDQLISQLPDSIQSPGKRAPARPRPRGAIPRVPWLPTDLLAIPEKYDPHVISAGLKRAKYIPEPLR